MVNIIPLQPLGVFTAIDFHVSSAGSFATDTPRPRESWLITDLDITFGGGPNGNFFWYSPSSRIIMNWRPGTENVQSIHWSGLQVLQPGQVWAFDDGSDLGMDVIGSIYLMPSFTGQ